MSGNPACLKGSAVVQPVIWPVVEGSKVNVGGRVICQEVLPFIVRPPGSHGQAKLPCHLLVLHTQTVEVSIAACVNDPGGYDLVLFTAVQPIAFDFHTGMVSMHNAHVGLLWLF